MFRHSGLLLLFTAACLLIASTNASITRFKIHGKLECTIRKDAKVHWIELWEADTPFGIGTYLDDYLKQNMTLNNNEYPITYTISASENGDGITEKYELYFKIMHNCTKSGQDYVSFRELLGHGDIYGHSVMYDLEVNFYIDEYPFFGRHRRFNRYLPYLHLETK